MSVWGPWGKLRVPARTKTPADTGRVGHPRNEICVGACVRRHRENTTRFCVHPSLSTLPAISSQQPKLGGSRWDLSFPAVT